MGRPRRSVNSPPRTLTVLRVERLKRGFTLQVVSDITTIPLGSLSEIERGTMFPNDTDLAALARLFDYADPHALLREAHVVPEEIEQPA